MVGEFYPSILVSFVICYHSSEEYFGGFGV
jgi:hypothetical protein